ncbi:MAG: DUF3368 domain-containing protein [Armatimonadetes bacterium]|nr:DUF3368 domain-containing protein [Armatimonadota bacterium]
MTAVCDTGPLIALAKVDLTSALAALFGSVAVPPAVYRELMAKSGPEASVIDAALATFVQVAAPSREAPRILQALGPGECSAIALALELGVPLIIDDKAGRSMARSLGLSVTGTVGVVVAAHGAGLVRDVRVALTAMRDNGYYFTDHVIDEAARMAENLGP